VTSISIVTTFSKNGSTIIFWELIILDKPTDVDEKKIMQNMEANLMNSCYDRVLEFYTYNSNNQQIDHDTMVSEWYQVRPGSIDYAAIEIASRYAQ